MHIDQVKTAKKYGDFALSTEGPNLISLNYLTSITQEQLRSKAPRVYIFVSDGRIKKIGGSGDKSGIKGTMQFYVTARQGSPGPNRFVLHHLIADELRLGHRVELYVIRSASVDALVPGLFDMREMLVFPFKEMETACVSDYHSYEGRYPDWNFQENHEPLPQKYAQLHNEFHNKRMTKSKSKAV